MLPAKLLSFLMTVDYPLFLEVKGVMKIFFITLFWFKIQSDSEVDTAIKQGIVSVG